MPRPTDKPRWIFSSGGPLILLPREHVEAWEGIDTPSGGRVIKVDKQWTPDAPATDYDRACDVEDLMGSLEVGQGKGIVLGGDPHATTAWIEGPDAFIVRWVDGESEEQILDRFADAKLDFDDAGDADVAMIEAHPGPLMLFDAACPGPEVEEDFLELALHPGSYLVSAVELKPDDEVSMVVIRLQRAE